MDPGVLENQKDSIASGMVDFDILGFLGRGRTEDINPFSRGLRQRQNRKT